MLQSLLQAPQLSLNLALRRLGIGNGLGLERLNGLDLSVDIVRHGLERLEVALDLVDNGLVLEHLAVVLKVDRLALLRERLHLAAGVVVAVLESLEGGGGLAAEPQGAGHLGPVELESCASLEGGRCREHTPDGRAGWAESQPGPNWLAEWQWTKGNVLES